ncbi:MAG: Hsp70 family protein [Deltaproteobacteria bacterium]
MTVSSELILGIDFGTSFSSVAVWLDGKMYVVPDQRGEPCIPSIVNYPRRGAPLVGARAEQVRAKDPTNTVCSVKRILGRAHDSPEVRIFDGHNAVRTKKAPGGGIYLLTDSGPLSPEQVVADIFRHLKALAERRFGRPASKAVITVPASATRAVEDATQHAAKCAGLDVVRVLSEPSAGAIANQLDRFEGERRILVYDFGGGTFDVTILEQRDQELFTRAIAGDACLGGDDLDHELASIVSGHIWKKSRTDVTKDAVRWERIIRTAETAKRGLSARDEVPFRVDDAYASRGRPTRLELNLTRNDVEPRWKPLVDRANRLAAKTIVHANLHPSDLDVILLVGGTTYVPLVRRTVHSVLKRPGMHEGDPLTAVARGAALVAARALDLAA